MVNSITVKGVKRLSMEMRVDNFVEEFKSMLNNHIERPKNVAELVFVGTEIPSRRIDCYGDAKKVEEKLYKISTTREFKRMTAEVVEGENGKITAYITF